MFSDVHSQKDIERLETQLRHERRIAQQGFASLPGISWSSDSGWLEDETIRIHGMDNYLIPDNPFQTRDHRGRRDHMDGGEVVAFQLADGQIVFFISQEVSPVFQTLLRRLFPAAPIARLPRGWFSFKTLDGRTQRQSTDHINGVINVLPRQANVDNIPVLLIDPDYLAQLKNTGPLPWADWEAHELLSVVEVDRQEQYLNPPNFAVALDHRVVMNEAPKTYQRLLDAGIQQAFLHLLQESIVVLPRLNGDLGCLVGIRQKLRLDVNGQDPIRKRRWLGSRA